MKYGTNQWARVASLLHKKSDKQCKGRWYEWLSPTVKKTEWTQEENERLLHLGKVLPTQWRTISDIIGRTAAQCVQQYSHLIDLTRSAKEGLGEFDTLRPDDNDLRPESRPAKPDPMDMAEDEIDMLNEARARLANTQGKKAKRKGRERQLIMARRLAAVQQKRELAEVGIIGRNMSNKKKVGVNYSEEIPFYQPIPKGFHDTTNEKYEETNSVIGKRVCELEFETREEREKRERKKDIALKRKIEEENLPGAINKGLKDVQIKRSKLVLSEPKISDEEMQSILKMSHDSDATLQAAVTDGLGYTSHLLGGYMSERGKNSSIIPDKTPMTSTNRLAMQAENIRSLHYTKTSLLGGANLELFDLKSNDRNVNKIGETPNTSLRRNLLGTPSNQSNIGTSSNFNTPNLGLGRDGAKFNSMHKKKLVHEDLNQLPIPNKDPKEMMDDLFGYRNERIGTSGEILDQDERDSKKENRGGIMGEKKPIHQKKSTETHRNQSYHSTTSNSTGGFSVDRFFHSSLTKCFVCGSILLENQNYFKLKSCNHIICDQCDSKCTSEVVYCPFISCISDSTKIGYGNDIYTEKYAINILKIVSDKNEEEFDSNHLFLRQNLDHLKQYMETFFNYYKFKPENCKFNIKNYFLQVLHTNLIFHK